MASRSRSRVCGEQRALGDVTLKDSGTNPEVALIGCEPTVLSRALTPSDRLIILATDGLWDVLTDVQAVKIASDAGRRAQLALPPTPKPTQSPPFPPTPSSQPSQPSSQQPSMSPLAAHAAAEALVRRAGELGSLDNVCVLVAWVEGREEGGAVI